MKYFLTFFLLIFLAACTTSTTAPSISSSALQAEQAAQADLVLTDFRSQEKRMLDIWWRIASANNDLCPQEDISHRPGFRLTTRGILGEEGWTKAYDRIYGSGPDWLTVAYVYQDSPAAKAGLQAKDRILSIDGQSYKNDESGRKKLAKHLQKTAEAGTPLTLRVRRESIGKPYAGLDIIVKPQRVCYIPAYLELAQGQPPNAFTDGERIYFLTSMMEFLRTDEEVALVMGHELAHATEMHPENSTAPVLLGGLLDFALDFATGGIYFGNVFANLGSIAFSQEQETEADYIGVYMMTRAGYETDGIANVWRRMSVKYPSSIEKAMLASHPSSPERFLVLEETVKEVKRKQKYGQPLLPERQ